MSTRTETQHHSSQGRNRLAQETSPYLLQHANNPVDWFPWGPEALEKAKREEKPIFLSIGYSACHWCHVMERESFESDAIAELLNKDFVCIKVDREERPDIDELYMKFVTSTTGSGGWPMSVFLTSDCEPFYGGTYFPPQRLYGRPGFNEVLGSIAETWKNERSKLKRTTEWFATSLRKESQAQSTASIDANILDTAAAELGKNFDSTWGGFGSAPKFPHAMDLRLLLRHWKRTGEQASLDAVTISLDRMLEGGVYDQLGGGFHRYSTDDQWLIPHFEKMLYDNALLVPTYLEAFLVTQKADYARIAKESCEWVLREMVTPEGAFASTQDADTEGEEGRFFAWTPNELVEVLGSKHGVWAAEWWGVTEEGNFEHDTSALWRHESPQAVAEKLHTNLGELIPAMESARQKLFEHRNERVHPDTDDKVLVAWNGLMISAMAQAACILKEPSFLEAAAGAARYILENMRQPGSSETGSSEAGGRLFATARNGKAHLNAYLDDYAFLIAGLVDLYQADFNPDWIRAALELNGVLEREFTDRERGGYFTTGASHEQLLSRLKGPTDGALPSGNAVQTLNLLRLAELTGNSDLAKRAEQCQLSVGQLLNRFPQGFSQMLMAVDFASGEAQEIVIAGELVDEGVQNMLGRIRANFRPDRVVALADQRADFELMPILKNKTSQGQALAYVCENYACLRPTSDLDELTASLS